MKNTQTEDEESKSTYIDGALHARLYTGALKHSSNLANRHTSNLNIPSQICDLLRIRQLLINCLRPCHWHNKARIGKTVVDGEIHAVFLDVGDDDCR